MASLQPVRGTQDLLPVELRRHRAVSETARGLAERYGFQEIATPIFEFTDVFSRPIGPDRINKGVNHVFYTGVQQIEAIFERFVQIKDPRRSIRILGAAK